MTSEAVCFCCKGTEMSTKFDAVPGVRSGEYRILQCKKCSMAFVHTTRPEGVDYSDYGEHITREEPEYYDARISRISLPKRVLFRYLKRKFGMKAAILDFGSGAGFFVKSCQKYGFEDVYGVEPSIRLRNVGTSKLSIDPARLSDNLRTFDRRFDVISMLDVIEHLPVDGVNDIMDNLVSHLKPGGVLLGTTPNLNSLNIKLFKTKDPVIAPPRHTIYFSRASLDAYLRKFNLKKRLLVDVGLSTNSFFRADKFSPSWVERPKGWQAPLALGIRGAFAGLGGLLGLVGEGYGMYFVYEKAGER